MNTQRGIVMIMVLIFLGLGGLTIAPTLSYAGSALKFARVSRESSWSRYAVDALAQEALWKLQYDTSFQCDPAPTPAIKFSNCVASKSSWTLTTKALPTQTPLRPYTIVPQINNQDASVRVEVPGGLTAPPPPTPTPLPSGAVQCTSVSRSPDWVQVNTPITYTVTIWACTSSSGANNRTRRIKVLMPPSFTYVAPTTTTWLPVPADMVPDVSICDGVKTAPETQSVDWYPCPQSIPPITDGTKMLSWPGGESNYDNNANINLSPGQAYTWTFQAIPTTWGVFYVDALVCYFSAAGGDPGPCGPGSAYRTGKSAPVVVGMFNIQGQGKGYAYGASSKLDNTGSDLISQQPK